MTNVINFPVNNAPDEEFLIRDDYGRVASKMFTASYTVDNKEFSLYFYAKDFEDAERHILALQASTTLCGEMITSLQ